MLIQENSIIQENFAMGLNGSTRDARPSLCDVKVIGAWRFENVAFLKI